MTLILTSNLILIEKPPQFLMGSGEGGLSLQATEHHCSHLLIWGQVGSEAELGRRRRALHT